MIDICTLIVNRYHLWRQRFARKQGLWELVLVKPIIEPAKGKLTVAAKDRAGNLSRIEQVFAATNQKTRAIPGQHCYIGLLEGDLKMTTLTVGPGGKVQLPNEVCERYGLAPETVLRVVETRGGILLVPQGPDGMSDDLARELQDWQALGEEAWAMFPYEDDVP